MNKRYFTDLMQDRGLSLREVAKIIDVWPGALSRSFSGKRKLQLPEAVKLAQVLSVPLTEVLRNAGIEGAATDGRRCNIIGHLGGDGTVKPLPAGTIERAPIPDGLDNNVVAIQAHTSDTPAAYADGWLTFLGEKQNPIDLLGMFSLVEMESGEWRLVTVRRGYEMGTFNLFCPRGEPFKNVRLTWGRRALTTVH